MDYGKFYSLQDLAPALWRAEKELMANPLRYRKETSYGVEYHVLLEVIASKIHGSGQVDEIATFFGDENISYYFDNEVGEYMHIRSSILSYSKISDDSKIAWQEIDRLTGELSTYLSKRISRQFLKKVYFGFEDSGNWGLIAAYSDDIFGKRLPPCPALQQMRVQTREKATRKKSNV